MCDQQRLRPACAYAQSDQSLSYLSDYSMSVKLLSEHHLVFLSLKGGCRGSSESTLVKMPHCLKSHALAHMCLNFMPQSHELVHVIGCSETPSTSILCERADILRESDPSLVLCRISALPLFANSFFPVKISSVLRRQQILMAKHYDL